MRACSYEYDIRTGTDGPWHGLRLEGWTEQARFVKGSGPSVTSMIGVGGKTSTTRRLVWKVVRRGLKVLVVTMTHMVRPGAFGASEGNVKEIRTVLRCHDPAMARRLAEKGKIAFTGWELYREVCFLADLVLVEAGGSKRLPLKVPRTGGPVIPDSADMILYLNGLPSLGKRAKDCCLRLEEVRALMNRHGCRHYEDNRKSWGSAANGLGQSPENRADWIIQKEDMMTLINYGYLLPLRVGCPGADVLPMFNQADTPQEAALAGEMLEGMGGISGAASGQLDQDVPAWLF